MTPYELILAINVFNEKEKQKQEDDLVLTYLGACWQRVNKLPSLNKILGKDQVKKEMNPHEMLEEVKRMHIAFSGATS